MASIISVLTSTSILVKEIQKLLPRAAVHFVQDPSTDKQFKKSHVIVASYELLIPYIYDLPNAKWVQGTWAGVNVLIPHIKPDQHPSYIFTRFSGTHFGTLMSEYVIANIVNRERAFWDIRENQKESKWTRDGVISEHRTLNELTIGVMGLGCIGNAIAKNLKHFGANIIGLGRRSALDKTEDYKHISQYYSTSSLVDFLKNCDYFVNVLPSTAETKGLLNGSVLENCKDRGTVFINIGRGSIISEACLVEALKKNWLIGAILDVFEEEPLSKESPLWRMNNVFLTPHVSGCCRDRDIAEHFVENYKLFEQNKPVKPVIDFNKGY